MSSTASARASARESARTQLVALAERGFEEPWPHARGAFTGDARPASVLVLFGVLDDLPADRAPDADTVVPADLDVLLLARAATLRSHAGQVAFPGGRAEDGEDAVTAALREAEEETGLDPAGVEVLGAFGELPMPVSNHVVTPVLGWWARPTPVRVVDVAESAHVFRAPVADLLDPANRFTTVMRRGRQTWRGPGFHVHDGDVTHLVWGFTGGILDAMFDQLGWTETWDRTRELEIS
ncbi:NUDIX hydrolase [Promicromonospora thailandica]|uniref:ADP-ribose pyrophosphatase YjhB, NUDIX family n=1 Tax=Promicromonospora thailandica TaxID=765201 RepID=A0A9X2G9P3_9MICO|nr:CoA pyrophosphatase [Promicromonospora thailandica]MCP2265719.1 ADP-ribose pyrophosphatase YjhB, NUDIX family [Promicromonospora thailandica]BFF21733.1 CoA pyrophosphatase [Promicromonospora thailandica]